MKLNFSEDEILFQKEVKDFLSKELPSELVDAAKQNSAVFTEKEVAMTWLLGGCLEDSAYMTKTRWKWLVKN